VLAAVVAVTALAASTAAPAVGAAALSGQPQRPAQTESASPSIGHVVFITKSGKVKDAAVGAAGTTEHVRKIGPVSASGGKREVQVDDLVASGDGKWAAWQETVVKESAGQPEFVRAVVALDHLGHGAPRTVSTGEVPSGFAKDELVLSGANTDVFKTQPSPHLSQVSDPDYALTAYPRGVVDTESLTSPSGPKHTVRLRLTSFAGSHTTLHNYVLAPDDYRIPDAGWTSADARELAIERGDHTDFAGIGPSSLLDVYSLSSLHRRTLGHFGSAHKGWRVGEVGFAGPSDRVWAMWERATKNGATADVAVHHHGGWKRIVKHAIAVSGQAQGYVIVQPGKFVAAPGAGASFNRVPTGDALLINGSSTKVLGIEGSDFQWTAH
jgi:hypothetical protein